MKLAIIPAIFLSGCAVLSSPPGSQDPTTWVRVADPLPMVWQQVPESELVARCAFKFRAGEAACAFRLKDGPNGPYCLVISSATEAAAKSVWMRSATGAVRTLDGRAESLYEHEKKHCGGFSHEVAK